MMTNTLFAPLRRLGVVAAILVALGPAFAVLAAPASAHTRLISSSPGRESTVAPVSEVTLVFSDKIRTAKVLVKDAKGKAFEAGPAKTKDKTVTQALKGKLPLGGYTIVWRVVGEDGHPIQSENPLKFTVDAEEPAAPAPAPSASPSAKVDTTTENPSPNAAPKSADSDSGGGATWLMIGSGLVLGAGIGFMFVFMRKRKPSSGNGE